MSLANWPNYTSWASWAQQTEPNPGRVYRTEQNRTDRTEQTEQNRVPQALQGVVFIPRSLLTSVVTRTARIAWFLICVGDNEMTMSNNNCVLNTQTYSYLFPVSGIHPGRASKCSAEIPRVSPGGLFIIEQWLTLSPIAGWALLRSFFWWVWSCGIKRYQKETWIIPSREMRY